VLLHKVDAGREIPLIHLSPRIPYRLEKVDAGRGSDDSPSPQLLPISHKPLHLFHIFRNGYAVFGRDGDPNLIALKTLRWEEVAVCFYVEIVSRAQHISAEVGEFGLEEGFTSC